MASASSSLPSGNEIPQIKELRPDGEWLLSAESIPRFIESIHITAEDDHVFLVAWELNSIIELNERGEMLMEFSFDNQNNEDLLSFRPYDICSISPDVLAVCGGKKAHDIKIVFLERKKSPPFLELKRIITTEGRRFYSLCLKNESIFCLDSGCNIHSFSKEGEEMKDIEIDRRGSVSFITRIRVDPVGGKFWASGLDSSKIVSFTLEGETFDSVKKAGKKFVDFSFDKFGQLYFPTKEGICSCFPEIKTLFEFPEKSKDFPIISVSENKMIVCFEIEGEDGIKENLMKSFKIIY